MSRTPEDHIKALDDLAEEMKNVRDTGTRHFACIAGSKAIAENKRLFEALALLEYAEHKHANCDECDGACQPEECGKCFQYFDDARLARRAVVMKKEFEKGWSELDSERVKYRIEAVERWRGGWYDGSYSPRQKHKGG